MTSTMHTRYLDRPAQGRIAYDVHGTGPLILLVPGMGELRSTYRFLAPALVAAGYTVAMTDLRGHGDSDAGFSSFGDVDTAGDVTALLRELGEPAVIVGNSMAAGSAVIVAAEHPELVSGLVLVGPFVRNPAVSAIRALLFRVIMARPWAVAAWKAYLPTLNSGTKPADFTEYRDQAVASMKRPGYARAFSLTTRTDHALAEASLPAVHTPTLVVMGEKDPDFKDPQDEAEWIAEALRGNVVLVPDAGHYPHSQQPDLTSAAVLRFLAGLSNRA
ncbi:MULTISPECIES: alpha/beta fold hydrolase [unclassified Arthrobacter]|uniref:alpha/beta fold hydrolase n=1 Tax=unclassified Arthrobacter TaxID=235627 RepID=UPI002DFFEE4C|nr:MULTISPECIES: alpha/beta hydrolase [unclassified Arthrobacter]MEC5193013.1 pimeloyl-ACP methyl ester carboxylesterase [Arthrobacter sp. MP_M4]MEC5204543.1 pimeloyl-ACP methyl ester carboxylesterase [Arthrobacter sp. MP_M7]